MNQKQDNIKIRGDKHFTKWRGGDVSRLEGFSDAVFAIAITLLVIERAIPKNDSEFINVMWVFIGFGVTFLVLAILWYNNFLFHRRFGLEDGYTIFLNSIFIFTVLFYIYPLKFMAQILINYGLLRNYFGIEFDVGFEGNVNPFSLHIILGIGMFLVWFSNGLMYLHAYQKRTILNLDKRELEITTKTILADMIVCSFAVVSMLLSILKIPAWSEWEFAYIQGWMYCFIAPVIFIAFYIKNRFYPSELIASQKS